MTACVTFGIALHRHGDFCGLQVIHSLVVMVTVWGWNVEIGILLNLAQGLFAGSENIEENLYIM